MSINCGIRHSRRPRWPVFFLTSIICFYISILFRLPESPGGSQQFVGQFATTGLQAEPATGDVAGGVAGADSLRIERQHGPVHLTLPRGYTLPEPQQRVFETADYQLIAYSRSFAQGELMYVEIRPPGSTAGTDSGDAGSQAADDSSADSDDGPAKTPRFPEENFQIMVSFADKGEPVDRRNWGYRAFIALAPALTPGAHPLRVSIGEPGHLRHYGHNIAVADTRFPVYTSQLDLGRFSDQTTSYTAEELALIRRSSAHKATAFARRTPLQIESRFAHPRDEHHVTSPFYSTRVVQRYVIKNGQRQNLEPRRNTHTGLDLRGLTGAPIYALANGEVAIAEKMFFEGNVTFIDHGMGILSVYMHQSELLVQAGQQVEAGQLIGKTGATGMVTGPHLHLSLYIRGVPVEPLSLICLPVQ